MADNSAKTDHTLEDGRHASRGYQWCAESLTVPKVGLVVALELVEAQMVEPLESLLGELAQKVRRKFGRSCRGSEG